MHDITCDVCGTHKIDGNEWWGIVRQGFGFRIEYWRATNIYDADACSKAHTIQLLKHWMSEQKELQVEGCREVRRHG